MKRGFALSMEVIIVSILALVVLVVMLAFVFDFFPTITKEIKEFPRLEIEPTYDRPIEFLPLAIKRGKDNKMSIAFYNRESADIPATVTPRIECQGIDSVSVSAIGIAIPVHEWDQYKALVKVDAETPTGAYSCNVIISETQKSFFLDVT